jgi:hypothetical protein
MSTTAIAKPARTAPAASDISPWTDAAKWLPMGPHCVLATDLECHFIAVWDGTDWCNAWTDEPIDSIVTHWMELPDMPVDE